MPATAFKCGYVALCGAPNVGKSTLLNRLVADKVAITSPKPQTTRHRLLGVVNLSQAQILFLDTPGLMDPKSLLNENLVRAAVSALNDADVVIWLVTPQEHEAEREMILSHLRRLTKPLVIAINKIDTIAKPEILPLIELYHSLKPEAPVVPIAAILGGWPAEPNERNHRPFADGAAPVSQRSTYGSDREISGRRVHPGTGLSSYLPGNPLCRGSADRRVR